MKKFKLKHWLRDILLALIGASHASGGIRGFLANRAMKKLGLKSEEKPKKQEPKPTPQE